MPTKEERELWNTDPDAAYAEAERRVAEALASGATALRLGGFDEWEMRALPALPPRISELRALTLLNLGRTKIADAAPLANLSNLQILNLDSTQIADAAPLANLSNLQFLDLSGTKIADAAPLANLSNLQFLYLSDTQIADLMPIRGIESLETLFYTNTPAAREAVLAKLTALDQPAYTVQTLQYLNGTHPEYGGPPEPPYGPGKGVATPPQEPGPITAHIEGARIVRDDPESPAHEADMARLHEHFRNEVTWFSSTLSNQVEFCELMEKVGDTLGDSFAETDQLMLGVHALSVAARATTANEELMPDPAARLQGFSANLKLFVMRLEAWREHVSKAQTDSASKEQIAETTEASKSLLESMRDAKDLFGENLIAVADDLYMAMADGVSYGPETPYGFYRSMMNVMIVVAQAAMDTLPDNLIRDEVNEAKKALRKHARKFVYGALGSLVLLSTQLPMWAPLANVWVYLKKLLS